MDVDAILAKPRWAPLRRFVEIWYAEPLGATTTPVSEIDAVEAKLGCRLPLVVREWYRLVGHRLVDVNCDRPVPLDKLGVWDGRLALWRENQDNWSVEVAAEPSDDDLPIEVGGEHFFEPFPATVTQALLGMVYSDTFAGVLSGCGDGPLGKLGAEVVGGSIPLGEESGARIAGLPALGVWPMPYTEAPPRGHETLVVDGRWMAATAKAAEEAATLFELGSSGQYVLVLWLTQPSLPGVTAAELMMQGDVAQHFTDGAARYVGGHHDYSDAYMTQVIAMVLRFATTDPVRAFEMLRPHLSPDSLDHLTAGYRPEDTIKFTPCWPPGAETFHMPM